MKVFLIAGKAGSGKNEVANIIKDELSNTVITAILLSSLLTLCHLR